MELIPVSMTAKVGRARHSMTSVPTRFSMIDLVQILRALFGPFFASLAANSVSAQKRA
jgi:hypothetical protein